MMNDESPNPYVGPRAFTPADKDKFFGRDLEQYELYSLISANQTVLLYAQSGSGKTSLFNAGVLPLVREDHLDVRAAGRVQRPSTAAEGQDVQNIYAFNVLNSWDRQASSRSLSQLTIKDFITDILPEKDEDGLDLPLLLVIDQFEEVFTLFPERWPERRAFIEQLREALMATARTKLLILLREDYLAHIDALAPLFPGGLRTRYRLEPLRHAQALDAITKPIMASGRSFEPGVAEKLADELLLSHVDVDGEPTLVKGEFVEPVQLQVVCERLWRALPPDAVVITDVNRRDLGDVDKALGAFYASAIQEAAKVGKVPERQLRKWIEEFLITELGTRSTVVKARDKTAGMSNRVVESLERNHILRVEVRAGARWYELAHDRLIPAVQQSNLRFTEQDAKRQTRRASRALTAAWTKIQARDYRGALQSAQLALELYTQNRDQRSVGTAYAVIGDIHWYEENYHAALENYERARDQFSEIKDIQSLLSASSNVASALLNLDKPAEARKAFEAVLAINPSYYYAVVGLADVARIEKRFIDAEAGYRAAMLIDPDNSWPWIGIARLYDLTDRPADAISAYAKASEVAPWDAQPFMDVGSFYWRKRRYADASDSYRRAVDLDPDNVNGLISLGDAEAECARFSSALECYERAATVAPGNSGAWRGKGGIYRQLGDYEGALEAYRRAAMLNDKDFWSLAGVSIVERDRGNYEGALRQLATASALLDEPNAWAVGERARLLLLLGRYSEALASASDACRLDEENDWWVYCRARANWGLGDVAARRADLHEAIRMLQSRIADGDDSRRDAFNIALYQLAAGDEQKAEDQYRHLLTLDVHIVFLREASQDLSELLLLHRESKKVVKLKDAIDAKISTLG